MTFSSTLKRPVLLACAALTIGAMASANAQGSAPATTAASAAAPTKAQLKAQRKSARKEARAKRAVDLKKLEDAGYQPGKADPNYPQSMQSAAKKAGEPAGASQ